MMDVRRVEPRQFRRYAWVRCKAGATVYRVCDHQPSKVLVDSTYRVTCACRKDGRPLAYWCIIGYCPFGSTSYDAYQHYVRLKDIDGDLISLEESCDD